MAKFFDSKLAEVAADLAQSAKTLPKGRKTTHHNDLFYEHRHLTALKAELLAELSD